MNGVGAGTRTFDHHWGQLPARLVTMMVRYHGSSSALSQNLAGTNLSVTLHSDGMQCLERAGPCTSTWACGNKQWFVGGRNRAFPRPPPTVMQGIMRKALSFLRA